MDVGNVILSACTLNDAGVEATPVRQQAFRHIAIIIAAFARTRCREHGHGHDRLNTPEPIALLEVRVVS